MADSGDGAGVRRPIEIAVRDGGPSHAVAVMDLASGRRFGAVKRLVLTLDIDLQEYTAELSYLKLEGSPDVTLPPDRPESPILPFVADDGSPELVTEMCEVVKFVTHDGAD